jgi:hypothetical protein
LAQRIGQCIAKVAGGGGTVDVRRYQRRKDGDSARRRWHVLFHLVRGDVDDAVA